MSLPACIFCKNLTVEGKIIDGEIICNGCEYKFSTCYKCKKKTFKDGKCIKCNFAYEEFKCQFCDKVTRDGVLTSGIFKCDECRSEEEGKRSGYDKCPSCKKYGLEREDDCYGGGTIAGGDGWGKITVKCKLCYHSNSWNY